MKNLGYVCLNFTERYPQKIKSDNFAALGKRNYLSLK